MAERKKPKPPVPGKPKPTPAKKKPAAQVPVTSVTPRSTVKKPSAKQVAGTRKVVANLAGVTPIGRGAKLAKGISKGFDKAITKTGKFGYGGEGLVKGKRTKLAVFQPFGASTVKGSNKKFTVNASKKLARDVEGNYSSRAYQQLRSGTKPKPKVKSVKSVVKKKK